ncbi:hypothetical protein ACWDBO_46760 [Streptomyces mirabilis]|uniref:hypothetical protein n=1 Tax=Streptomyces mirabilis TaxID=68239 RepID=UPI00331DA4E0
MSTPVQQPTRPRVVRRATVGALSDSAVVGALTVAGAPWEVVVAVVAATLPVSFVLGLAQIVMPGESEHKRDLLLAWIRHRERRDRAQVPRPARRTSRARDRR